MSKPTTPPPGLARPLGWVGAQNLDALTLEEVEAMRYVYKHLAAYCNERAKVLRLQEGHGFRIAGALSIKDVRLTKAVFTVARGTLLGMAHLYNRLPEWARWPKVWRQCVGGPGDNDFCTREGTLQPCPYASDLNGDETLMPLCDDCAVARTREL